ncbi:prolyl oligopeptidase family protein [Larkinella arboricola]|uniref:Prolyl oligopeptidase family protein n=1 Tax=Larkinella arboricola TaxID=643671 RepID=A0A327WU92_LARAB|nr:prolyl oligopeptidase family serine peptidase [Larkinella arboricola]RAJ96000.1 prolyl oligopeptidase family protein [Larkinella arboricola]
MHQRVFSYVIFFLSFSTFLTTQAQKRPLTHADYDRWQNVRAEKHSNNGQWLSYQIDPQEGDGRLELIRVTPDAEPQTAHPVEAKAGGPNLPTDLRAARSASIPNARTLRRYVFPRGYLAQFTPDSRFLVMRLKAPYQLMRTARKKKVKADQLPKDSLLVFNLETGNRIGFANVKSYIIPKESGSWAAILLEHPEEKGVKKDSSASANKPASRTRASVSAKKPKGDDMILLNLETGLTQSFRYVTYATVSDNGHTFFYNKDAVNDTLKKGGVFVFDTRNQRETLIDTSSKHKLYKGLAVDKTGSQLAWMATADSADADVRAYALYYKRLIPAPVPKSRKRNAPAVFAGLSSQTVVLADTLTNAYPKGWNVNEYRTPGFSQDGKRLYFATSILPPKPIKDSTQLDEERVKVDIWSWNDPIIQPMQLRQLKQEKERGFLAVCDLATGGITQLGNRDIPNVQVDTKYDHPYWLGLSNLPYQINSMWDPGQVDLYLINAKTGQKNRIANDVRVSYAQLSPGGKYAWWYDERDSLWRAWSIAENKRIDLTRGIPARFFDEEHDTPDLPGSYGAAGWSKDDRYVLIYDRFDLWRIDPTGQEKAVNLTAGYGRKNGIRLRRVDFDREEKYVNLTGDLWLTGFWEKDKSTGILRKSIANPAAEPVVLTQGAYRYASLSKARNAPTLTFHKGNFREPINLYLTDTTFAEPHQLTRINPQQDSIRWGSVELVNWIGNNGVRLEGLLYKPEDFDPKKKYPMLVYYYERNAETLNDYKAPAPSRSTINMAYCVSNGYLVFVPDIVYTTGMPGQNAYDCIVPGVLNLIEKGFVDRERIGLQGQSWGGYQTAFLVTKTNLFKAAMAGAPVANMTSAYGGIRWGTGMSRMFQYEKTQSRIGGTLWDKPMNYIESSPLFYANRIQTPLLLMANDQDGAVPWYQSIEFYSALRRLRKPAWLLVYNGEDHNLTQRHNAKDLSVRMYQFFDYYLKEAPEPAWMKQGRSAVEKELGIMKY